MKHRHARMARSVEAGCRIGNLIDTDTVRQLNELKLQLPR